MESAPFAPDETGRLLALKNLGLLDTAPERRLDRVVQLATRLAAAPIGILSLVDERRVFFKSAAGTAAAGIDLGQPFRDYWFCSYVVATGERVVVGDAAVDDRFSRLPLVTAEPGLRAYAGVPVRATNGAHVGALAVLDVAPRRFRDAELKALGELARLVEAEFSALPHSTTDALTGAVNARTFARIGDRVLEFGDDRGEPSMVLHFDIAGIGQINREHGFDEGDRALRDAAGLVAGALRGSDLVGRVGPDEFGAVLLGADPGMAKIAIDRLRDALRVHNETAGRRYQLSFHIGESVHHVGDGADLAALLTAAAFMGDLGLDG